MSIVTRLFSSKFLFLCLGFGFVQTNLPAQAGLAVANGRIITFFDSAGTQLETLNVPYPGATADSLRDLTYLNDGRLAVFNGTFNPFLSIYDSGSTTWTHATVAKWSTSNNSRFGGMAAYGDYVFMSDANTSGGELAGSIRYNLLDGTSNRFDTTHGTHDVNVGLDGLVYSLGQGADPATVVKVYNPTTLTLLRTVTFQTVPSWQPNSVAADADGRIYVGNNALGAIYVFEPNGAYLKTLSTGKSSVRDLDLNADGSLLFGTFFEGMFRSNPEQTTFTRVGTTSEGYGAFAIPEPGTTALIGLAAGLLCLRSRRHAGM